MPKHATIMWTLVRHSAWTAKRDPCFEHAVEENTVEPRLLAAVVKAGGLLFTSYSAASDRAEAENYPDDTEDMLDLIPKAKGTFKTIGKNEPMDIYIPR